MKIFLPIFYRPKSTPIEQLNHCLGKFLKRLPLPLCEVFFLSDQTKTNETKQKLTKLLTKDWKILNIRHIRLRNKVIVLTEHYLKPEEVASLLKISKYTVYEMVKRNDLPAVRIGRKLRFRQTDIDRFIDVENNQQAERARQQTFANTDIRYVGSNDLSIDAVAQTFSQLSLGNFYPTYVGSMEGLMQLYHGKCDVVGCHLFDEETGQYNLPYIKRFLPHEGIVALEFVKRNLGWVVPKGNPNLLTSWEDLKRRDLLFVNRQKGSGTRVLFDYMLKKLEIKKAEIRGYDTIEFTHLSAASHVSRGAANAALATESVAVALSLDFVPLQQERYDLVMKAEFFESKRGQALLHVLSSNRLKEKVALIGGYDVSRMGKKLQGANEG
jgi:putative molybdopterin biosynthesis protein